MTAIQVREKQVITRGLVVQVPAEQVLRFTSTLKKLSAFDHVTEKPGGGLMDTNGIRELWILANDSTADTLRQLLISHPEIEYVFAKTASPLG